MGDLISRQTTIEAIEEHKHNVLDGRRWDKGIESAYAVAHDHICDVISRMPTAEKVGKWIPIKTRPMDEVERAEWSEKLGYDIEYEDAVIYTSQLPDDGQEVLTCSRYGTVRIDRFENDPDYGCFFEENGDMDGIVAWMPLPEPWRGETDGNHRL